MTYAPATLRELGGYWTAQGGVNLGIVGDARHLVGYHLGRDRIFGPNGRGWEDYSVKLARDKAGLSDGAAAIDLGRLNGSLPELYRFSSWLVARCTTQGPATAWIREVIYSPDGVRVQRWSAVDNIIHTGPGNGDASHIGHTHISAFRDTENVDKRGAFAPYFEGDDMPQAAVTNQDHKLLDIPKGADVLDLDGVTKLYENAFSRTGVQSDVGRGSELRAGVPWVRREWVIDPDGSGPDRRRTVLVWLPEANVRDADPFPADPPETHRYVVTITADAFDPLTIEATRDGGPIP